MVFSTVEANLTASSPPVVDGIEVVVVGPWQEVVTHPRNQLQQSHRVLLVVQDARREAEVPAHPAFDCIVKVGHEVTEPKSGIRNSEQFLYDEATEERLLVRRDCRYLGGTQSIEHKGVAAFRRSQLQHAHVSDTVELRDAPSYSVVLEKQGASAGKRLKWRGQQRTPLTGENVYSGRRAWHGAAEGVSAGIGHGSHPATSKRGRSPYCAELCDLLRPSPYFSTGTRYPEFSEGAGIPNFPQASVDLQCRRICRLSRCQR